MFVKFKFPYGSIFKEVQEGENSHREWTITKEAYDKLRELVPELPEDPLKRDEHYSNVHWYSYTGHLESILEVISKIEIESVSRTRKSGFDEMDELLYRMTNSLREMELRVNKYQEQLFNKKVQVHIPGNALLDIEEVCYETDCCTDKIQKLLNSGWRIIAVCPQPDQRRPDYILGIRKDLRE